MDLMSIIAAIPGVGPFLPYVALAVAVCALVAMALPAPGASSGVTYRTAYALVNLLGANKGHATNATAPASTAAGGMPTICLALLVLMLAACTTQQLASSPGQLFCALQTAGGGTIVAGLIDAEASSIVPGAAPVVILATNMGKAYVDGKCADAAQATGALGAVPVSPPANPGAAPQVAVPAAVKQALNGVRQ